MNLIFKNNQTPNRPKHCIPAFPDTLAANNLVKQHKYENQKYLVAAIDWEGASVLTVFALSFLDNASN